MVPQHKGEEARLNTSYSMGSISDTGQLWWALGYCGFMWVLALILRKYPPKKINHFYGYRTNRSMKNQRIWDAANEYSSELMYRFCIYSFLIPVVCYFLFPSWNLLITVVGNTLLIFLVIYYTEKYLSKNFDENGDQLHPDSPPNG
jgi:uncharacterized membrane protein